jgi:hypothetical protein
MGQTLLAVLLLAAGAQPPSGDAIARQLDSTDARTVAWGAYNAGAYHREDMIPRLQRILQLPPPAAPQEERTFLGTVMDALVQLNASVEARVLVPYVASHPVHTAVLLSRANHRDDVLLDLLPRVSGFQWFAAADMLFEDRSPELAEYLVRTTRLQLTVYVADSDGSGFGEGAGGAAVGCGIGQNPPAYPPHAEYRFELAPHPGVVVLSTGPHPVYYSRTLTTTFQYATSGVITGGPTDEDRVTFLRAMSADTGTMPFRAHTQVFVGWSTAEALLQRVQDLRDGVEQRFRGVVERARHYYPVPDASLLDPPIDLRLVDQRRDQTVPLPKIVSVGR